MQGRSHKIASADVEARSEVDRLVSVDADAALRRAREIRHPWYRCQALSTVAAVQRSPVDALKIINESLSAAHEQCQPNRIVSAASWPLRQLALLDPDDARIEVEKLLQIIGMENHGLRRLDGIGRIVVAIAENSQLLDLVKPALATAATVSDGWRIERTVAFVASYIAPFDKRFALELLSPRHPNRFRNTILKKLNAIDDQKPA